MSRKFIVLSALALGLIVPASAKTYTREDAIKTAMENSAEIKAAEESVIQATSQVESGYGKAYPSIDLNANVKWILGIDDVKMGTPMADAANDSSMGANKFDKNVVAPALDNIVNGMSAQRYPWQSSVSLTVTQILYAAGQVGTGVEIAKAYKLGAEIKLDDAKTRVRYSIDNAFNSFIVLDSSMTIIDESIKLYENNLEFVKQQFQSGLATELDLARLQLQLDGLKIDRKTLEEQHIQMKNNLLALMGVDYDSDVQFVGELRSPDSNLPYPDTAIANVIERRKDFAVLKTQEQMASKQIEIAEAGYKPTIVLNGGIVYSNYQNHFYKWDAPKWNKLNKFIGLNLSMNLFQGFQTREGITQAKSTLRTLQIQKESTERSYRIQIENCIKALDNAERNLVVLKSNVELAERVYQMTEASYQNGMVSQLDLLSANMGLRDAKQKYLTGVMAWNVNYNALLQATGEY